ncbi:MAG TPA: CsbD family protein [Bacteriovoracaceae bacterium]|nr:CsbD family protein [Bacteriovoracaceae bacterium]
MLNEHQIQGKWLEIKGGIKNLWGKLTDDELDETKGNLMQVGGLVEGKYGESKEQIKSKMDKLLASFDNESDRKDDKGESSFQRNPTATRTAATSEFQDKASEFLDASAERKAFENKTLKANQERSAKEDSSNTRDFDSDRNARH